jgi:glycosyltransferase involved in cell wall biosynthesis
MKKRILFILHFPPPVHGSSIVGYQIKESKIINESNNCRFINLGTSITLDETWKNTLGKLFRYIPVLGQVMRTLITWRPDLCYFGITASGIAFYKDTLVIILLKLFRIKLVYHLHNKGVSNRQHIFWDNLLYRLVFKNADIILSSKFMYLDIQMYVPEDKVYYCPNGIPNEVSSSIHQKTKKAPSLKRRIEILFLSNLNESKGVFVLLEACSILKKKRVNYFCTFVGDIGNISEKQLNFKICELNLEKFTNYIGKKTGEDKESEYAKADIFVLPTYNDCFPLVLLEAMQHSLPIVSCFEGSIPDIVENGITGFLVPQKDAEALAEKLEILINDPSLSNQMGLAGRKCYEHNFTLQQFEKTLSSILNQIIYKNH